MSGCHSICALAGKLESPLRLDRPGLASISIHTSFSSRLGIVAFTVRQPPSPPPLQQQQQQDSSLSAAGRAPACSCCANAPVRD